MINRAQFIDYWNNEKNGLGAEDSILWTVEKTFKQKSKWFINIKPINIQDEEVGPDLGSAYWQWCTANLQGHVICYSSSDDEEWWGFSSEEDITMWTLKWS